MSTVELFRNQNILGFIQTKITPDDSSPWLFVHIPQSVSYAVRCQIADVLQPEAAIAADDGDAGQTYDTRMSLALERFARSKEFGECRFVSGHFKVFQIDKVGELANAHAMTIMRDPVDRLLSDFAAQQEGKRVRVTAEAFLKFAKSPANRNILLQFLCPQGMWKPQECIEFIQNSLRFHRYRGRFAHDNQDVSRDTRCSVLRGSGLSAIAQRRDTWSERFIGRDDQDRDATQRVGL